MTARLQSVEETLSRSDGFNEQSAIYRGQTSDAWPLLPSLVRQEA